MTLRVPFLVAFSPYLFTYYHKTKMQNSNNKLTIGIITGARRTNPSATTAREYYNSSPLFRYRVKYCEQKCDKIYILSPEKFLITLDDLPPVENQGLENIVRENFREWKDVAKLVFYGLIPGGSTLIFLTGNRFRQLIPILCNKYICEEPTKGMDIGKQLKYFINLFGKVEI